MMNKKFFLLITVVIMLIVSCKQAEFPGFKEAKSGLLYKINIDNTGVKAVPGDYITLEMTYKTNEDSLLFDAQGQTFPLQLEEPVFDGDINEALAFLGTGDSATFVIRADSFLIKNAKLTQLPSFVNEQSKVIFYVKVHNIQTLEELQAEEAKQELVAQQNEEQIISEYINSEGITAQPTSSGLYFILEKAGKGKHAEIGKKVTVHFTGMFLNGTVFDSSYDRNKPISFRLGMGEVLSGWDEGIAMMKAGDEATLIIPSKLGYGKGRGQIPPFTPLLFKIKLIDVK